MIARLVVIAAVLAAAHPARAQEAPATTAVAYRVRQGDSLELIAAEFYGDRNKAVYVMAENKLSRPRPLKPGERLRVPVSHDIVTAPDDTFESLAQTHLGNARRGTFLADFNGMSSDDSLAAGTLITIPLTIVHTAAAIESMGEISRLYYGDAKNGELLRRYNQLDKGTIERGDSLMVPVYQVRVAAIRQPPLDAEAKARRERHKDAMARAARALPAARQAWKDGDFAQVAAQLGPLDGELDYLDAADAADAGILIGATDLASDRAEHAAATFKRVIDRQPRRVLKRYQYSPKIIAVWQKAGGPVE
ncbi:MAG TPA: LysM peptidoglycan-binding domain-containing protein [Kofleriaceae bacterium]